MSEATFAPGAVLTEHEFEGHFVPLSNPEEEGMLMFPDYDDFPDFFSALPDRFFWTQISCGDELSYVPGKRSFNCEGYIICLRPWTDETLEVKVEMGPFIDPE